MYTIMSNITTTTIKLENSLYDEFRTISVKNRFSLKELVVRAMYLYTHDTEFRNRLYNFNVPKLSPEAQSVTLTITGSGV